MPGDGLSCKGLGGPPYTTAPSGVIEGRASRGPTDKATATQLANIEKRTGKSLAELRALVSASGLTRHGELVAMLKRDLGMGHGDADTLVHVVRGGNVEAAGDVLDGIYSGPKAHRRPVHERIMERVAAFGPFEIAPKKGYVSLRRKKLFALVGPATNTRIEVGLNIKDGPATERLVAMPPGGMCQFKVRLGEAAEVDDELIAWLRRAYDSAG